MPRYGESSHETPAYFINTIARLKLHLCDLAYNNDDKRGGNCGQKSVPTASARAVTVRSC